VSELELHNQAPLQEEADLINCGVISLQPLRAFGSGREVQEESRLRKGAVSFYFAYFDTVRGAKRWSIRWIIAIWMNASLVSGQYS
jgi:hypothetical protein